MTAAVDAHAAGGGGAALLLGGASPTCPQWAPWALRAAEAQLLRLSRGEATQASLLTLGGQGGGGGGGAPRPVVCVGFDSARLAVRFGATSATACAAVDLASSSALRLLIRTLPHTISAPGGGGGGSAPGGGGGVSAPSMPAATVYADLLPQLCAVVRRALASLYDPNAASASGGGGAAGGSILVADSAVASAKPESLRDLGTVGALLDLLGAVLAGGAAAADAWMPLLLTAPVGVVAPSLEQLRGLRLPVDAAGRFVAEADCLVGIVAQAAAGLRERINAGEAGAKGGDGSAGGGGETLAATSASKAAPSKQKKSKASASPYSSAMLGIAAAHAKVLPKGPWMCAACGSYNSKGSGQSSCSTCGTRRTPESAAAAAAEAAAAAVAAQAIVERLRPLSARLSSVDAQLQAAVQAWAAADPTRRQEAVVAEAEGGAYPAAFDRFTCFPTSIAMGRAVSVEDTPQALASAVPPLAPLSGSGAPPPLDPVLLVSAPALLGSGDADSVVMARQLGISSVRDVYRVPGALRRRYEEVLRDETFDTVDGLAAGHEIVQVWGGGRRRLPRDAPPPRSWRPPAAAATRCPRRRATTTAAAAARAAPCTRSTGARWPTRSGTSPRTAPCASGARPFSSAQTAVCACVRRGMVSVAVAGGEWCGARTLLSPPPPSANMDVMRAAITGADGTPYCNGFFSFDIKVPPAYPAAPPQVVIITRGEGAVRFNPNLYANGKASHPWGCGRTLETGRGGRRLPLLLRCCRRPFSSRRRCACPCSARGKARAGTPQAARYTRCCSRSRRVLVAVGGGGGGREEPTVQRY